MNSLSLLIPVLQKIKSAYVLWYRYYQTIPKAHRYTLGSRIDGLFVEIIETIACASFLARSEKQPYVRLAIRKLDTVKVLLMVLWETKSLEDKKYIALSVKSSPHQKFDMGMNLTSEKLSEAC